VAQTRDFDPENSVIPSRCDSTDIGVLREGEGTLETAVIDFHGQEAQCLQRKLLARIVTRARLWWSPMPANYQTTGLHRKLNILRIDSGQFHANPEAVITLEKIYRRLPSGLGMAKSLEMHLSDFVGYFTKPALQAAQPDCLGFAVHRERSPSFGSNANAVAVQLR
jgi:hypothetical protein